MIGLDPYTLSESIILLKLPKTIQKEATDKGIGKKGLTRIAEIKDKETQEKVFRKVADEDLSYEKTAKLVSMVKKSPEPIKEALLKEEPSITPELTEEIKAIEPKISILPLLKPLDGQAQELRPYETLKLMPTRHEYPLCHKVYISAEKLAEHLERDHGAR